MYFIGPYCIHYFIHRFTTTSCKCNLRCRVSIFFLKPHYLRIVNVLYLLRASNIRGQSDYIIMEHFFCRCYRCCCDHFVYFLLKYFGKVHRIYLHDKTQPCKELDMFLSL